jgi:hypothetical protein
MFLVSLQFAHFSVTGRTTWLSTRRERGPGKDRYGELETGWDDPALAAVMAGKGKTWPPSGRGDWLDDQLTAVRLRVLDACGRTQEYLNLARAARAHTNYAVMLVKLERKPEAIAYAKNAKRETQDGHQAKLLRLNAETGAQRLWPLEGMGCGVAGRGQIIFWEGQHEGSAPLRKLPIKALHEYLPVGRIFHQHNNGG